MAEPNPPSELDPVQSRGRHPSQDQTPGDDAAPATLDERSSPVYQRQRPALPEDEHAGAGQAAFGRAISTPAPEGESLTSPEQAQAQAREAADRMGVFRGLPRELIEREWSKSGTRKLILERIAQLEIQVIELKKYRAQYYDKDKEAAVLRQKLRQSTAVDMLFDLSLAAGGALVGLSTSLFEKVPWFLSILVVLIGLIFFVSPLFLRYYQKAD
jgi:hypothetical protein